MKKILTILINLLAVYASAQNNKLQEKYFNVDRVEIYSLKNNVRQGVSVLYFEGKIILSQTDREIKSTSIKYGTDFFKFKNLSNGNFKIFLEDEALSGIYNVSLFQNEKLEITLKNNDEEVVYYLTKLTEDDIYSTISSGSGIFINNNTVLTNYHVVKSYNKLTIEFQNKIFKGKVIKYDEALDIALVKIDDSIIMDKQHLNFADYNIEIGKETFVSGFPFVNSMGKELKITSGIISSTKGFNDDDRYVQTTAPVDPGNSGGPLIDENGNIIGITTAKHNYGTNVGYALKVRPLIIEKYVIKTTSIKNILTTQQIYNKAKNTICIIKSFSL
jgi:S1-C subfamily serine protease